MNKIFKRSKPTFRLRPQHSNPIPTVPRLAFRPRCAKIDSYETIEGVQGNVTIAEGPVCNGDGSGCDSPTPDNGYYVDVEDGVEIFAFGVSTNNTFEQPPFTTRPGWAGEHLSETQWNDGFTVGYDPPVSFGAVAFVTDEVGLFDDLFGTDEDHVYLYVNFNQTAGTNFITDASDTVQLSPGTWPVVTPEFRYLGNPDTQFTAFNTTGGIVGSSVVPEPGSLAMMMIGIVLNLLCRRRSCSE